MTKSYPNDSVTLPETELQPAPNTELEVELTDETLDIFWWGGDEVSEENSVFSYRIEILASQCESDDCWREELEHCDGSSFSIIAEKECIIPLSSLLQEPYHLTNGQLIKVRLIEINASGETEPVMGREEAVFPVTNHPHKPRTPTFEINGRIVKIDWTSLEDTEDDSVDSYSVWIKGKDDYFTEVACLDNGDVSYIVETSMCTIETE